MKTTDTEAHTAVEKAATGLQTLYAPSVLDEAAALLSDLWAAGERHDVPPKEWDWAVSLTAGALEVIANRYTRAPPTPSAPAIRSTPYAAT